MPDEPAAPPAPAPPPDPADTLRQQLATANQRLIQAELKSHALRAGIIDLDCLKLLDASALTLDENGTVPNAAAALANLKRDKPWLFTNPNSSHPAPPPAPEPPKTRMAKDMTVREWQIARDRLIRGR
jgi:hypothetical protein